MSESGYGVTRDRSSSLHHQFMPSHFNRKSKTKSKPNSYNPRPLNHNDTYTQHGSPLLDLPNELLTQCTSFLEPSSLLSLGQCNQQLYDHIKDDNTWRRAFDRHYFNIGPETKQSDVVERLTLRRTEATWKREYVSRHRLLKRYEKSRSSSVAHQPTFSDVASFHALGDDASILSASMQYGIVARSDASKGKVLKGYLTASSPLLGIGNPNADFSPNISCIVFGSAASPHGASVLWGSQSGEVALTYANRVMMDGARVQSRFVRCLPDEEHSSAVVQSINVLTGVWATADAFGRVKLWEGTAKKLRCLWTSKENQGCPCVCLAADIGPGRSGVLVAGFSSGAVVAWSGITIDSATSCLAFEGLQQFLIPLPPLAEEITPDPKAAPMVIFLDLISSTPQCLQLGVCLQPNLDTHFSRIQINLDETSDRLMVVNYGGDTLGPITTFATSFASNTLESSFVLAGDKVGNVHLWPWDETVTVDGVGSVKYWEAHNDGGVSVIKVSDTVIATGSTNGTIALHSALTLTPLRTFSAAPRLVASFPVSQIIIRNGTLLWSMGSKVLYWKLGDLTREIGGHSKRKNKGSPKSVSKGIATSELKAEVAESTRLLQQQRARRIQIHERYTDQSSALNDLGLDEIEAVEYALMLSRDEAELQKRARSEVDILDDVESGVLLGDNHIHIPTPIPSPTSSSSAIADDMSRISSTSWSASDHVYAFRRVASSDKIQISPRIRPEARGAAEGFEGGDSSPLSRGSGYLHDEEMFPSMPSSVPSTSQSPLTGVSWSSMLKGGDTGFKPSSLASRLKEHQSTLVGNGHVDDDLQRAIQLSLAEAEGQAREDF